MHSSAHAFTAVMYTFINMQLICFTGYEIFSGIHIFILKHDFYITPFSAGEQFCHFVFAGSFVCEFGIFYEGKPLERPKTLNNLLLFCFCLQISQKVNAPVRLLGC